MCDGGNGRHFARVAPQRARSSTTSNANGKRDSGEPGLAGWRICADYDNDGVRDTGEPYADTDASATTRSPASIRRTRTYTPARAAPRRRHRRLAAARTRTPRRPAASPPARAATSAAAGARSTVQGAQRQRQGLRQLRKKPDPKITVIKKLVPASDSGRFDLMVDSTIVKAAAGDGDTGSTTRRARPPPRLRDRGRPAPTSANYTASIDCKTKPKTYGPGWVDVSRATRSPARSPTRAIGKVEIAKVTDPHETGGTQFGFTGFAGAFSLADGGVEDDHARRAERDALRGHRGRRPGYRLTVDQLHRRRQHGAVGTRTASIRSPPARPSAARSSTRS